MTWSDLCQHVSDQYGVTVVMADGLTAPFTQSPATADPEHQQVLITEVIERLFAQKPAKGLAIVLHEVGHILDADATIGLIPAYQRLLGRQTVTRGEFDAIWDSELRAWCFAKLHMQPLGYVLSTNLVSLCLASYHLSYRCLALGEAIKPIVADLERLLNDNESTTLARLRALANVGRLLAWPLARTVVSSIRYARRTAKAICA